MKNHKPYHQATRQTSRHCQASIIRDADGIYRIFLVAFVTNPLIIRVDRRRDISPNGVLRIMIDPTDRFILWEGDAINPLHLALRGVAYYRRENERIQAALRGSGQVVPFKPKLTGRL